MYPYLRLGLELALARRAPALPLDGVHVTRLTCRLADIDLWGELNNGRTLTLYDLGRVPLAVRTGLVAALRRNGWGLTVAGASVRYRRRVRAFERVEIRSAYVGRDPRFIYVHQAMFRKGEPVSSVLIRGAVVGPEGIVPTERVITALRPAAEPALPAWVTAWSEAEAARPWPPDLR
jgi:acyl-CoA thioesterase FadM